MLIFITYQIPEISDFDNDIGAAEVLKTFCSICNEKETKKNADILR